MGFGTEIWFVTGESEHVSESYEHVDKLLNTGGGQHNPLSVAQISAVVELLNRGATQIKPVPEPSSTSTSEKRPEPHKVAGPKAEPKIPESPAQKTSS